MIYGFDTEDREEATAALLVYAIYRSRDPKRFKVTPDMWGVIERGVKASSKRATTLPRFIEALKPKLACSTISPRWMEVGIAGALTLTPTADGGFVHLAESEDRREFLTDPINDADPKRTIDVLYRETAYIVLLVRDRLEREKPVEKRFAATVENETLEGTWISA